MLAALLSILAATGLGQPRFCSESPIPASPASVGRPSNGALLGAVKLEADALVRVLPLQARRCLDWDTPRLIAASHNAADAVMRALPGSLPLPVGDLSRARGGPITGYSRSHQSGRDADLAYFQLDGSGEPVAAEEFVRFNSALKGVTAQGEVGLFDVAVLEPTLEMFAELPIDSLSVASVAYRSLPSSRSWIRQLFEAVRPPRTNRFLGVR